MILDGLSFVRSAIDDRIEALKKQITSGTPQTYEKYREMIGTLRGLQEAYDMTLPQEEKKS